MGWYLHQAARSLMSVFSSTETNRPVLWRVSKAYLGGPESELHRTSPVALVGEDLPGQIACSSACEPKVIDQ